MNGLNRLRYKILTSFGISALGLVMIVRLWGYAAPSSHTALAYAAAGALAVAGLWRGIIFARAARAGVKP